MGEEVVSAKGIDEEYAVRQRLIDDISSSHIWLNLYNNSIVLNTLCKTLFDVSGIESRELKDLADAHFLIYCEKEGLCELITNTLNSIMFDMNKEYRTDRSIIRGSINWSATFQQRMSTGLSDRTLFVTSNTSRDIDTPSNQLIKFLLNMIIKKSDNIIKLLLKRTAEEETWYNKIVKIYITAKKLLSHPKLQSISKISKLDYSIIDTASRSRNANYRYLSKFGDNYYRLFIKKSPQAIKSLIESQVLVPAATPAVFEFAVLFKVLDYFENQIQIGDSRKMVIMRANDRTKFVYEIGKTRFSIYYQAVPNHIESHLYSHTLGEFGYTRSMLRPDIMLVSENLNGDLKRSTIIEVKYSQRVGYTYEGLKDVLSYLYDFKEVDKHEEGCAILATYLPAKKCRINPSKVWISGYSQLSDTLIDFIEKMK